MRLPAFVKFQPQFVWAQTTPIQPHHQLSFWQHRAQGAWSIELANLEAGSGRGIELDNPPNAVLFLTLEHVSEQDEDGMLLHGVIFAPDITTLILGAGNQHLRVEPQGNLFAVWVPPEGVMVDRAFLIDREGRMMALATQIR